MFCVSGSPDRPPGPDPTHYQAATGEALPGCRLKTSFLARELLRVAEANWTEHRNPSTDGAVPVSEKMFPVTTRTFFFSRHRRSVCPREHCITHTQLCFSASPGAKPSFGSTHTHTHTHNRRCCCSMISYLGQKESSALCVCVCLRMRVSLLERL